MKNLSQTVTQYLSKPTDYAIQVSGDWGIGKTHYYRNSLQTFISNQPVYSNQNKNYKPIYISLFGLKSIEDIATKIVFDLYQSKLFNKYFKYRWFKRKLRITSSILKISLRGFLNFHRLGNTNDYLTDITELGSDVLDSSELVICFDDLERKDSSLNIEDLTGYINSLVDEGIKVLLISNDDLLQNEPTYKNFKEKIIGITIEFVPEIERTIKGITQDRYQPSELYQKFIDENWSQILILSNSAKNNFRHLIYALDNFHYCYSCIEKEIFQPKHEIADKMKEEMSNIFKLTMALSIEYKASTIKHTDYDTFDSNYQFAKSLLTDDKEKNTTKSKYDIFVEKYNISKDEYHCYKNIYNYVTGYDEFDIYNFIEEFKKEFKLEQGNIPPHYEVFNSLSYRKCFLLTDEEYRAQTETLISYAQSGLFLPSEYLSIMHFAERFDNMLDLNLNHVKEILADGLKQSIKEKGNDYNFTQFKYSGQFQEISNLTKELFELGITEFEVEHLQRENSKTQERLSLLINDTEEFRIKYYSEPSFKGYFTYTPIFNNISPIDFIEGIKRANSETIYFINYFIKETFQNKIKNDYCGEKEINFISDTRTMLIEYKNDLATSQNQKLRLYVINDAIQTFESIETEYNLQNNAN